MRIPLATYRLQLTPSFRFKDTERILSYLKDQGISDIYASPILESRTGSQHGYDLIDFRKIDAQLGGEKEFYRLTQQCRRRGLGWLQDIVPNHMGYHPSNPYIHDVLEKGRKSVYSEYFDVNWQSKEPELYGKILFPFLEKSLDDCLKEKLFRLLYQNGKFLIRYQDFLLPLCYRDFNEFRTFFHKRWPQKTGYVNSDLQPADVQKMLEQFNQNPLQPDILQFWQDLLSQQHYLPAYWKVSREKINYRRFFSINELICLQVERETVFNAAHQRIIKEVRQGNISGLRIDHLDGLFDPAEYLQRCKKIFPDTYLVVEKILQPGEMLPSDFATEGNTGYDFLHYTNHLLCPKKNQQAFVNIYRQFTGQKENVHKQLFQKKRLILKQQMYGDLKNIARMFYEYSQQNPALSCSSLDENKLLLALQEIMIRLPVYRTYLSPSHQNRKETSMILGVIEEGKKAHPDLSHELDYISNFLIRPLLEPSFSPRDNSKLLPLVMRLQQFTGPLMAKGMEDTLLYCYHPLVSLNEVGGDPAILGISRNEFHHFIQERRRRWPDSMNATMTHDTKRGEDVRARLNVLSEMPTRWKSKLYHWHQLNHDKKVTIHACLFPDRNMEYFLYQTLLGTLPFQGRLSGINQAYRQRIQEYLIKAAREAKIYTSWLNPYQPYEDSLTHFIGEILTYHPKRGNPFLDDLLSFQAFISGYGVLNSLAQLLLKLTCPGVPDFYQGAELWDLRLVDPDNRRPVDYSRRINLLRDILDQQKRDHKTLLKEFLENPADGKVKLFFTYQLLKLRNQERNVFQKGSYHPMPVQGRHQNHMIAYLRSYQDTSVLVVLPRFCTTLVEPGQLPLGEDVWQDTSLRIPVSGEQTSLEWISQEPVVPVNPVPIGKLLKIFPMAVILIKKGICQDEEIS